MTWWNEKALDLLNEVMRSHADPDSPDYNECDKDPCAWCTEAKELIDA